jgi:hypothetical protein
MKKIIVTLILSLSIYTIALAQTPNLKFIDGKELNLIGKIAPTANPYQRIDTARYHGFTSYQNTLVTESAGLALCFKTNSKRIAVKTFFHYCSNNSNSTGINLYGYDLYIKKDGKWLYAGSGGTNVNGKVLNLVSNMNDSEKECLLYLPSFSVIDSMKVGIEENANIKPMSNPFRHRIIIHGSSFTHGTSSNRSGMSYPLQIERNTGLYIMDLGVSGNCLLEQSFAHVLADAKADAFIFDAFSNPSAEQIKARFDSFVETIRKSHPTTPLIFLQTIYREKRNFDESVNRTEQEKMDMAVQVVTEAMKHDKNIYFINAKDVTGNDHISTTDGVHPSALGYYRWATAIQPLIINILSKYNIK